MISVLYTTIMASLVTTIVFLVAVTQFHSSRVHGFVLYAIYATFLVAAVSVELQLF